MNTNMKQESGVVLPILTVMLTSIMAVMFVLYLNSATLGRYDALFRTTARSICRNVAQSDKFNLTDFNLAPFADQVNRYFSEGHLGDQNNFNLLKAELLLPTMLSGTGEHLLNTASVYYSPYSNFNGNAQISSFTGVDACSVLSGPEADPDCLVHIDVTSFTSSSNSKAPVTAFDKRENAMNTIGCFFEARVKTFDFSTFLFGKSDANEGWVTLVANYSFWRPLKGDFPDHHFSNPDNDQSTWPGITIAVAPHMTTDAALPQFNWQFFGDPTGEALESAYSPVYELATGAADPFTSIPDETVLNYPFGMTSVDNVPIPVPNKYGSNLELFGFPGGLAFKGNGSGDTTRPSDLYEMLTACSNPVVLVRNMFLATFAQLASRHGQMRAADVLQIGTQFQSFHASAFDNYFTQDNRRSPPIRLSAGDMLKGNEGQLPGVFGYQSDDEPGPPPPFPEPTSSPAPGVNVPQLPNGPVNPFSNSGAPVAMQPQFLPIYRIMAQQMRACAHLYKARPGGFCTLNCSQSLITVPHTDFYNYSGAGIGEAFSKFEDYFDNPGLKSVFNSGMSKFDQSGIYDGVEFAVRNPAPLNTSSVDAITLLGMLGTIQQCPYNFDTSIVTGMPDYCEKPTAGNDLRPDYLGLLQYLRGLDADTDIAVKSPGIFPIVSKAIATRKFFDDAAYIQGSDLYGSDSNTPVVIVTHKPPTDAEAATISEFFGAGVNIEDNWSRDRAIYIVHIPASAADLVDLDNFNTAFHIGDDFHYTQKRRNHFLFVIQPEPAANELTTVFTPGFGVKNEGFAEFHRHLLAPPEPADPSFERANAESLSPFESIELRAQRLFLMMIENAKRKF